MKSLKFKPFIVLLAAVFLFSACKKDDDDEKPAASFKVNSITTTDGTDLYGATSASSVATDQDIIIGFSGAVNQNTLGDVKLITGDNTVPADVSASGSTVTITPNDPLFGGTSYTVQVKGVQSTEGVTVNETSATFTTAGIGLGTAPRANDQILYLQLNGNAIDLTGNNTASYEQVSYTTDRFGNENSAAYFNGNQDAANGDLIVMEGVPFVNPSTSISVWFKLDHADYPEGMNRSLFGSAAQLGFFLELGNNMDWIKMATSHKVSPDPAGHEIATAWGDNINGSGAIGGPTIFNYEGAISDVITSNEWHHFVMTFDHTTSTKSVYIDGQQMAVYVLNNDPSPDAEWNMTDMVYNPNPAGFDNKLGIGFMASNLNTVDEWNTYEGSNNTFIGAVDDFRIWKASLTNEQVTNLYNAEKP